MTTVTKRPTRQEYESGIRPSRQEYESTVRKVYPAPTEFLRTQEVPSIMAEQWLGEPPKEPEPQRISVWEPTLKERIKNVISDMARRSPFVQPGKRLGQLGLHHLSEAVSGIGLYIPDILANKITQEDTLASAVDKITGFEPTPRDVGAGEAAKFVTSLHSVGKVLGPAVAATKVRPALQIILGSGVSFGGRKATEELAKKITTGKPIDVEGIHFESGIGVLFGTGVVGVSKFVNFVKNIRGLPKAQIRPARAEVNAALKHYQKTGDRTRWDAVRVKYAGIKPKRVPARQVPPEVREFGKYPIARPIKGKAPMFAEIRPTAPIPAPERPLAPITPPEGVELPPKPVQVKPEAKITPAKVKFDPTYADIHANARKQLREDRVALTWGMWKKPQPPGMKGSKTRIEWEKAYEDEARILGEERRTKITPAKAEIDVAYRNKDINKLLEIAYSSEVALSDSEKGILDTLIGELRNQMTPTEQQAVDKKEIQLSKKFAEQAQPPAKAEPARTADTMAEAIALSSPSGKISKRAKKAAVERLGKALFGEKGLQPPKVKQPTEAERLKRQAKELRVLAERGMSPKKFLKQAKELEERVAKLAVEAEPAKVEKKPWEMTKGEFIEREAAKYKDKLDEPTLEIYKEQAKKRHWKVVHDAVFAVKQGRIPAEKRRIPREVLEEYKDEEWARRALRTKLKKEVGISGRKKILQERIRRGEPVPAKLLEEYKSEKWAQEALKVVAPKVEGKTKEVYDTAGKKITVPDRPVSWKRWTGGIRGTAGQVSFEVAVDDLTGKVIRAEGTKRVGFGPMIGEDFKKAKARQKAGGRWSSLRAQYYKKPFTAEDFTKAGITLEQPPAQVKGKPGFVDVRPLLKVHKTFMDIVEPSKAVEMKLGKEPYAAVIKGVHQADVGRIEFNEAQIEGMDKSLQQLSEWFSKYANVDLKNFMISRGEPTTEGARLIQRDAREQLHKDLKKSSLFNAVQRIADSNYKYLQSVVGDDIHRVEDYFYGIYKNPKQVDKFLDYWRTTKRFTKEKKLPTVADAVDYGLGLRNYNPIENLKSEYLAISHLEGMNWLRDELLRTGKGKFIEETDLAPLEWDMVQDPVFKGFRMQPDLAKMINNLIATNKITRIPLANTLREINNVARTIKFIGSAFHLLSVFKQSLADSGYLGFLYKKTALRGFTTGFRKNDPVFRTTAYKDYIRHGGGHRYSVESEARRTFNRAVDSLNRDMGKAVRVGALPLRIPTSFVNWMFQSYIPKVKYSKYLDVVAEQEKKLGRVLTSPEKIDIIKEQQNFYGMMNERLFGRSGTLTSAMRFYFMSPGYAEGNYRTMLKAATQWGGKAGHKANRSRSNIINSWLITAAAATAATMILTGKPPKKPENLEDARDLFKIDTGKKDEKGRKIMIDLMTYDKDYWNVAFNLLRLRPDVAVGKSWRRIGGMKAPMADIIDDLVGMSMGKAIYDWKEDRVMEITDPFLLKVMKLTKHEVEKLVPISVSVFQQAKKREIDTTLAAVGTLLGYRPTKTEQELREQKIISKMHSLAGQREEMTYYIGQSADPKRTVAIYNKTVNDILNSPYIPKTMKNEWGPRLLVDYEKVVTWKRFPVGKMTDAELQRSYNAHTLSIPYKRRGEPFRPIGDPKKGSERRVSELKAEAKRRGIELKRKPGRQPRR